MKKTKEKKKWAPPHVIRENYPVLITSSKGKKIKCKIKDIKVDTYGGDWEMSVYREKDDVFIMKMRWEE
jgi:hypothetical protein